MNPLEQPELLGPRLTKGEARPLENQAKRHYRAAGRNLARFAADLRRLQDGEAHLTRGFSSFGAYAEHTFDGLSAANAKKISVHGAVLLVLEHHERISLSDQTCQLPGATGLRALAAVLSQHDEDTMLAVYDKAAALRPGRTVVDTTVNLAVRGMLTPPPTLGTPAAQTVTHEPPPGAAGEQGVDELADEDLDDHEDPDEDPEAVHELHDRLIEIRRALDDLGAVTSELAAIRGRKEAERILTDLLEEIHELPDALAAAIASQHPDDPHATRQQARPVNPARR
jgi:hypothetical protein